MVGAWIGAFVAAAQLRERLRSGGVRYPRFHAGTVFLTLIVAVIGSGALPAMAQGSNLVGRNASAVRLEVNARAEALVTYRADGRVTRVLAWGAVNAIHPTRRRPQVAFRLDYTGGTQKYARETSQTFRNVCGPYRGPTLAWLVAACTAPDGSHWALQSWRRALPNYGVAPTQRQAARELRLSHWTGDLATVEVSLNWAYRRYHHLFGRVTYRGRPVHGFRSTKTGSPLDTFARNVYIDTLDSAYGRGWSRENAILTHERTGAFCYGFYRHGVRPSGMGARYRATIVGPGVTPDISWEAKAPGRYARALDGVANAKIRALGDSLCRPN